MDPSSLFTHTDDMIYFNHASSSPLPVPTRERLKAMVDELACGDPPWDFWMGQLHDFRKESALLTGATKEEIGFVPNTTTGLLTALYSIPWKKEDNIVLIKDGFPANRVPWIRNMTSMDKRLVPCIGDCPLEERLMEASDKDTRAMIVDWVDFFTGYRLDLKVLGDFCRERDIFLVVDGIQGLGSMELDVSALDVDFISAGSAKWLLGPVGAGILYINKGTHEKLRPAFQGWMSHDWREFNVMEPLPPIKKGAGVFEVGSYPGLPLVGLVENLRILNTIGSKDISARIRGLCRALVQGLQDMGAGMVSPTTEEHGSGIVTFRLAGVDPEALFNGISDSRIMVSLRKGAIRASPHFYNTQDEVERFLSTIRDLRGA